MRSLAFGHAVPSPMHIRSVIKQPLLHAIYFKPSVLQACLGKRHMILKQQYCLEHTSPSVLSHCCVHIWKSLNVILDCKQQLSWNIV